jgi:hypothetical protein
MSGMGCHVLCYDVKENHEVHQLKNTKYTTLEGNNTNKYQSWKLKAKSFA